MTQQAERVREHEQTQPDFNYLIKSLRLSHSTEKVFESCARKFEFRKLFLHPAREDSLPASVGQAMHSAWYSWLIHQDQDEAEWILMSNYPWHLNTEATDRYSVYVCLSTLRALIESNPLAEYEIAHIKSKDGREVPAIEIPFELRLKNIWLDPDGTVPITYVGRIDAILRHKVTEVFGVSDLKTHQRKIRDLSPLYTFDEQCTPYGAVLEHLLGRELGGFDTTYVSAYLDLMEPRIVPYTFPRTFEDVTDWIQKLRVEIELMRMYYSTKWFPRNSSACLAFNRRCGFFDDCRVRDPRVVQNLIAVGRSVEELQANMEDRFGEPWVSIELDLGI